jgi:hypothetical protein
MKAAQFTNHTKDSDRETLAQRRTIARLCVLFKFYFGGRSLKSYTRQVFKALLSEHG